MVTRLTGLAQKLIHHRAHLVHSEIQSAKALFERMGKEMPAFEDSPWMAVLDRLYAEEFPLAKVLDESELIAHAEGPSLMTDSPRLDIVTWLCTGVQSQTRALTASALNLGGRSRAVQSIQFRLNGLAPGSLFAGFSLVEESLATSVTDLAMVEVQTEDGTSTAPPTAADVAKAARNSIVNLTKVPAHVGEGQVSESLGEEITDPAQRDASLMAALKLAPTGRNGVSSVQLQARFAGRNASEGTLDTSNRLIIQDTLNNRPLIAKSQKQGSFVGQLRALDLDKTRVDLRSVEGVGSLRCIIHLDLTKARNIIGQWVKVTGEYETNASGRPRLLVARNIEVVPEPTLAQQLAR